MKVEKRFQFLLLMVAAAALHASLAGAATATTSVASDPSQSSDTAAAFSSTNVAFADVPLLYVAQSEADARTMVMLDGARMPGPEQAAQRDEEAPAQTAAANEPQTLRMLLAGIGLMLAVVWRRIQGG